VVGPPVRQHVAADQAGVDLLGQLVVPGRAQHRDALLQGQVGRPGQLVERVQVAAGPLHRLQCLADLSERVDRGRVGRVLR
jgi:hypothetical protein